LRATMPRSRGRKQKQGDRVRLPLRQPSDALVAVTHSSPLEQIRNTWWFRALQGLFGSIIVVLGLVASVYGIWGPIWPTAPEFSPGSPSFSFPLDVPFVVTDKSILFSIENFTIKCHVIFARLSTSQKALRDVTIGIEGRPYNPKQPLALNNLNASRSSSYVCPVSGGPVGGFGPTPKFPEDKLETATIEFISEYDSRWPWGGRTQSSSGLFTLNVRTTPPQWTQGVPLQ
jgi:hypothetical protein